jgi:hypothetical protein
MSKVYMSVYVELNQVGVFAYNFICGLARTGAPFPLGIDVFLFAIMSRPA